jgi:hypothetical protein
LLFLAAREEGDVRETTGLRPGRATTAVRADFFALVVRFNDVFFDDFP